jgi:hypothetical protein
MAELGQATCRSLLACPPYANITMLGIVMPTPADTGLNMDDKE